MNPLKISDFTLTTASGSGKDANWLAIEQNRSGLTPCEFYDIRDLSTWIGAIERLDDLSLPEHLQHFDCRNNRLAWLALNQDGFFEQIAQAVDRYGSDRVAVYLGTSTSGIHSTELAYLQREEADAPLPDWYDYPRTHNTYSLVDFVKSACGITGIGASISTACSSSAKAFASAERAMRAGWCDAALVGGVDSLCLTTLYGFNALQLVAEEPCRPSDQHRQGISIGEAGGYALLERADHDTELALLGYGESSDAYHMSSPHPQGDGAVLAMRQALNMAGLAADQVDYINLHGTGTVANDLSEARAIERVFGLQTPCSSTKGWTGHTLGAAGIVEALYALLSIQHARLPATQNTQQIDDQIKTNVLLNAESRSATRVMSNSFGFGGSNCTLLLGITQ